MIYALEFSTRRPLAAGLAAGVGGEALLHPRRLLRAWTVGRRHPAGARVLRPRRRVDPRVRRRRRGARARRRDPRGAQRQPRQRDGVRALRPAAATSSSRSRATASSSARGSATPRACSRAAAPHGRGPRVLARRHPDRVGPRATDPAPLGVHGRAPRRVRRSPAPRGGAGVVCARRGGEPRRSRRVAGVVPPLRSSPSPTPPTAAAPPRGSSRSSPTATPSPCWSRGRRGSGSSTAGPGGSPASAGSDLRSAGVGRPRRCRSPWASGSCAWCGRRVLRREGPRAAGRGVTRRRARRVDRGEPAHAPRHRVRCRSRGR